MIVFFSQLADSVLRNRVWLASLGAAVAINALLFWLASIAPMGHLPGVEQAPREAPVEIVVRRRVPPPPDLSRLADTPSAVLPPRFRPRSPVLKPIPDLRRETLLPPPRLRLNLNPCDPADDDQGLRPDCAPPRDWVRADRDASDLLGSQTQGYSLDEVAVARGWIKPKPRTGQDAMAAQTDTTLPQSIFKDAPFPPHAIERSAGP
jgi:hypothetical protein